MYWNQAVKGQAADSSLEPIFPEEGMATKKKKTDFSKVEFFIYDEGLCVQCMHLGSYDDEPATTKLMETYAKENGYKIDITENRFHHEIYLSDPRKCEPNKLKTVIRHPIKKI